MRCPAPKHLPHTGLHVREPIEINGRAVGRELTRCKSGWFSLAEIVVRFRYQRCQTLRSVGVVGGLRLCAPLAEVGPQLILSSRSDPISRGIGAVASEHERNTWFMVGLIGCLGGLSYELPVENRCCLKRLSAAALRGACATNHLFGTEGPQLGQRGLIRSLDSHGLREFDPDGFSDTG